MNTVSRRQEHSLCDLSRSFRAEVYSGDLIQWNSPPSFRKKIILLDTSPDQLHCMVILSCLRRKCCIRLNSRKLDPEGKGAEREHFNLWVPECQGRSGFGSRTLEDRAGGSQHRWGKGGQRQNQQGVPGTWNSSPQGGQGFSCHCHPFQ